MILLEARIVWRDQQPLFRRHDQPRISFSDFVVVVVLYQLDCLVYLFVIVVLVIEGVVSVRCDFLLEIAVLKELYFSVVLGAVVHVTVEYLEVHVVQQSSFVI